MRPELDEAIIVMIERWAKQGLTREQMEQAVRELIQEHKGDVT